MLATWRFRCGADHLNGGARKVLNLWTETEQFHLGHLSMIETVREMTDEGHSVTFYIGEFLTDFWTVPEFVRLEEAYRTSAGILKNLAPKSHTAIGFRP